MHLGAWQCQS